jgi:hypothetical protein
MRAADHGDLYKTSGYPNRKIDAWNNEDDDEHECESGKMLPNLVFVLVLVPDIRIFDINSCLL